MEENIKVITICDYYDIELKQNIPENKTRWVTKKRARELISKKVVRLLEIRKCIYEWNTTINKNAFRNIR